MASSREAGYDGATKPGPEARVALAAGSVGSGEAAGGRGMNTVQEPTRVQYSFGPYVFDPHSGELNDGQKTAQLRPQVAKLLELLLRKANTTVSREEIKNHLWGSHIVVEFEEGISACVRQLRIALNDGASGTRYIQTISRRGYKFVFPVGVSEDGHAMERRVAAQAVPATAPAAVTAAVPTAAAPARLRPVHYAAMLLPLLALAAVVGVMLYKERGNSYVPGAQGNPATTVAVLPFTDLSPDQGNAVLGASISNEVINLLGPIAPDRLGVIASTSTAHYLKGGETIKQIGQELGANYVLEGSIGRQAQGYHIAARLIRVVDQSYVWGDEYDLDGNYSGGAYRQLVIRLSTQVATLLAPNATVKPLAFTNNRDAAIAFQNGRYALGQGQWDKAYASCQQAVALDAAFAAAYTCAARARLSATQIDQPALDDARKLVAHAFSLDGGSAESKQLQGELDLVYGWNLAAAGKELKESLRLNPGDAWSWQLYAEYLVAMAQNNGMLNAMETARALDPASVSATDDQALVSYITGQYPRAESSARTNANLNKHDVLAQHLLTLSLLGGGKYADATQQALTEMQILQASPADLAKVKANGHASLAGYFNWYAEYRAAAPADKYSAVLLADAYMHLGKADQAYAVLAQAVAARDISILVPFLSVWPSLKPLCTRPDFLSLTKQLGQIGCLPQ